MIKCISEHDTILSKEPILKRMFETDDYIVQGTGGYYWANVNVKGCLIEAVSSEELTDIFRLSDAGYLEKTTKKFNTNG